MRRRLVRLLHPRGIHRFCRVRVVEPLEPVPVYLEDGTLWEPDLNGFLGVGRRIHW